MKLDLNSELRVIIVTDVFSPISFSAPREGGKARPQDAQTLEFGRGRVVFHLSIFTLENKVLCVIRVLCEISLKKGDTRQKAAIV